MGLFKKRDTTQQDLSGRRRHTANQSAHRAQVFSYYTKRSQTQANTGRGLSESSNEAALDGVSSIRLSNKPVAALGITALLTGSFFMLSLSTSPKVVTETLSSTSYFLQKPDAYRESIERSLASSLLNRSKLTIDTAKVAKDITGNYPEIKNAEVSIPVFGSQPVVRLQPYTPSFILTTINSAAYVLDENGRAVVSASQITDAGRLGLPTVQDKSGIPVALGSQALSSTTVDFIGDVTSILAASDIDYSVLALPPEASGLEVYITGTPYFVKFDLQGDAQLQTGTFIATKRRLDKEKTVPGQYIDVRVPGRAYYR